MKLKRRSEMDLDRNARIAQSLDNAVANGCETELAGMTDRAVAYDLAQYDADCERLPIETLIAGVRAWRLARARAGLAIQ